MKFGAKVLVLTLFGVASVLGQACSSNLTPQYNQSTSFSYGSIIESAGYKRFYWTSTAGRQVRIRADASSFSLSSVELYVSSTTSSPTSENFEFKSFGNEEVQGVVIRTPTVKCYAVAVKANFGGAFTLSFEDMAVNASTCALSPVISKNESDTATVLSGGYDYYYVEIPAGKQIRFRADPSVGDVNLFASNTAERPTLSDFQFSSVIQSDVEGIIIPSTSGDCYAFGVYGNSLTSLYTATAEYFDIDYSMCAYSPDYSGDSVSLSLNTVLGGGVDYYYYAAKKGKQITIRAASNFIGNVDLYVSSSDVFPSENSYEFNSTISAGAAEGLIFVAEKDDCYAIGVKGISALSEYSLEIEAKTPKAGSCPLKPSYNGTASISDFVLSGNYDYYYLEAKAGQYFTVTVDPTVGSVDLFISSATLYPTADNFQYNNTNSSDVATITVLPSVDACFAIAIRGKSFTTYYTVDIASKKLTGSSSNTRNRAPEKFELNYAAFFATISALIAVSIILVSLVCYGGPVGNAIAVFFSNIFCCRCFNSCRKNESRAFNGSYAV